MFSLHPLGPSEFDTAACLHRTAFAVMGERGWTRSDIAELLASPGVEGWLLQHEGKSVGFALCRVAADEAELLTIAVDPDHRRRGAARRLLDSIAAHAQSRGAHALFLEVGADNPAARALYDRKGFKEVGRRAGYYERGPGRKADALILQLMLGG